MFAIVFTPHGQAFLYRPHPKDGDIPGTGELCGGGGGGGPAGVLICTRI